jgi:3-mercaptopyruvate sulfurtransferase SseA
MKNKEFEKLLKYCEDNGLIVSFVDSRSLRDYSGMNPDAAKTMGFHHIKPNEIEIDRTMPEETQCRNLKHELIEKRLMDGGMEYWQAHSEALDKEHEPFDYSQTMNVREVNIIPVEEHRWGNEEPVKQKPPKRKRKPLLARLGIVKSK